MVSPPVRGRLVAFRVLSGALLILAGLFPAAAASPAPVAAVSTTVVVSQVYGGGGNAGATLRNDFIELFNRGTTTVDLGTWSVQYAAATGTSWSRTNLSGLLVPGQYYLVQEAQGAGGTANLPTPDTTGTIAMSATAGKVVLVSNQTTIAAGTSCPSGSSIVDLVGYGAGTNCFEGPGPAPTLSNTTAALRNANGRTDTDNNASDFAVGSPNPRNTASPLNPVDTPPVVTLDPIDQAVDAGATATFVAAATGSPTPTVKWQGSSDGGTTWVDVPGATSATLSFTAAASQTGYRYHAVFTNSAGSAISAAATLTVVTPPVVISQVYGGGGNAGATLRNDFIELFNRGTTTVDLGTWSIQYAATTGTSWSRTILSGLLAPGRHYLVQEAQGAGGTTDLPTPDAIGTIAVDQAAGKVALVSSQTTIASGTSCPSGSSIVDLVGYGAGTNCFEGPGPAPTLSNTNAALRKGNGLTDTDDNGSDFAVGSPNPRNTASPLNQTITFGPLGDRTYGDADVAVSAIASSGLTVSFSSLTPGVCTVAGTAVHIVAAGACTIRADQAGNGTYSAAPSVDQGLTVAKADPTCAVDGWTGAYDGDPHGATGACLGVLSETLAGLDLGASFTNVPGGTADWAFTDSTGNYHDASGSVAIVISKAGQAITFPALTGARLDQAAPVPAATTSSGLAVTYSTASTACTVTSSSVITLLHAGNCTIDADAAGNGTYDAAPRVSQGFTIAMGDQTITFGALAAKTLAESPVTISASASSSVAVTFTSNSLSVCTVSGTSVTLLTAGTCSITASQAGNADWNAAAPVTQTFGVSGGGSVTPPSTPDPTPRPTPSPTPVVAISLIRSTGMVTRGQSAGFTIEFGAGGANRTVLLDYTSVGVPWAVIATLTTNSVGVATFSYAAPRTGYYRARFLGTPDLAAATSAVILVGVRQTVTLSPHRVGVTVVARGTSMTFACTVRPAQRDRAPSTVVFRFFKKVAGEWVLAYTRKDATDALGKAVTTFQFPAGTWYVNAYATRTPYNAVSRWAPRDYYRVL